MTTQQLEETDEKYMHRCIALAKIAKARGNSPVGAVIVKDDQIIAEGIEGETDIPAPVAHAEIIAVLKAVRYCRSNDLSGCVLYTTKEPCFMCSYLIRQTKIRGIIFALRTEGTGGASSIFPILSTNEISRWPSPPFIMEGMLKATCIQLLQ